MAKKLEVLQVGHLHDDLTVVAGRVQQELSENEHLVWADDSGAVFMSKGDAPSDVPSHCIAGNFSMGQAIYDIEDDLRVLLRERAHDWIID